MSNAKPTTKTPMDEVMSAAYALEIAVRRNCGARVKVIIEGSDAVDFVTQSAEYLDRLKYVQRAPDERPRVVDHAGVTFRDEDPDLKDRNDLLRRLDLVTDELATFKGSDNVHAEAIAKASAEVKIIASRVAEPRAMPLYVGEKFPVLLNAGGRYVKVPTYVFSIRDAGRYVKVPTYVFSIRDAGDRVANYVEPTRRIVVTFDVKLQDLEEAAR